MEITLEKNDNLNGVIKIMLNEEDYRPHVNKKLKEYAKKATIKGFRPGKVPVGLIEKMYGKSILVDEVNNLAVDNLQNYIKEEKLKLIASPIFDPALSEGINWDNPQDLAFYYQVGLTPEIGEIPLKEVELFDYEVEVTDQELGSYIDQLKEVFAEHEHPEEVGATDEVIGNLSQEGSDIQTVGRFKVSDLKPEAQGIFVGQKQEAEVSFDLKSVFSNEELVAKFRLSAEQAESLNGTVKLKISHIGRKKPLENDQDFYDKVLGEGRATTQEEFEAQVRELLAKKYRIEASEVLLGEFRNKLAEAVNSELPEEFLRKWLQTHHRLQDAEVDRYFPDFKTSMRWEVVKNRLLEMANFEQYQTEDLIDYLKDRFFLNFFYMNFLIADESMLFGAINHFLQNAQEDNQQLVAYENNMITKKLISTLAEQLNIQKKAINPADFKEVVANVPKML